MPCAFDGSVDAANLQSVAGGGTLEALTAIFECTTDCVSKKARLIEGNTFQTEAFLKNMQGLILPERVQEIMEKCGRRIGQDKCKVTGQFYICFISIAMRQVFSLN